MRPARDSWLNPALALLLCTATGAACAWLKLPLPWMIGTALGLYFTPAVAREVAEHWSILFLAAAIAIFLGVLGGWVLSRVSGVDATTAFFASVPGGAAEMAILGERFHARVDRIALAQSLRVLVVVIVVPFALTYSGAHGDQTYVPVALPFRWEFAAALLAIGAACAWLLDRLHLPNAFFFGPLAATIALTVSDLQFSSLPMLLTNTAQVLLGCALGARFEETLAGERAALCVRGACQHCHCDRRRGGLRMGGRQGCGAAGAEPGAGDGPWRHRGDVHYRESAAYRAARAIQARVRRN